MSNSTYAIQFKTIKIPQERMPCCPLCDNPIFGGEPAVIGKVTERGETAFALVHKSCTEG